MARSGRVAPQLAPIAKAFERGRLTLYLGAGASVPSGLPTWQRLVWAMYFDMLRENNEGVYSNYLHAVAEWMLQKSPDPLEITAQKIRRRYGDEDAAFRESLRRQLYNGFCAGDRYFAPERSKLRRGNGTLRAIARLVERSSPRAGRGVEAVITYNYDNLLEIALSPRARCHVAHNDRPAPPGSIPIYHVHGYVPLERPTSGDDGDIIFTEEQYHEATNSAYSWSNLVQLRSFSSSTGLMIGLSLSDRNIRRLLHAVSRSPVPATCFALLQKPTWRQPYDHEEHEVDVMARQLYDRAKSSGSPVPPDYGVKGREWREQVRRILGRAHEVATEQHERVLEDLGVTPIWYERHEEIPQLLGQVVGR